MHLLLRRHGGRIQFLTAFAPHARRVRLIECFLLKRFLLLWVIAVVREEALIDAWLEQIVLILLEYYCSDIVLLVGNGANQKLLPAGCAIVQAILLVLGWLLLAVVRRLLQDIQKLAVFVLIELVNRI